MEHNNEVNIICPYCGYEDKDSWEFTEEEGEQTCGKCEEEFNVTRSVNVTYSTSRIECKEGKHKYKTENFNITKRDYIHSSPIKWIDIPEDKWKYFRTDICELCDDTDYVDLTKEEYQKSYKKHFNHE